MRIDVRLVAAACVLAAASVSAQPVRPGAPAAGLSPLSLQAAAIAKQAAAASVQGDADEAFRLSNEALALDAANREALAVKADVLVKRGASRKRSMPTTPGRRPPARTTPRHSRCSAAGRSRRSSQMPIGRSAPGHSKRLHAPGCPTHARRSGGSAPRPPIRRRRARPPRRWPGSETPGLVASSWRPRQRAP